MVAVIALGVPSTLSAPIGPGESNAKLVPADSQLPNAPPPQPDGVRADPPPGKSGVPHIPTARYSMLRNPEYVTSQINPNLLASKGLPALTGDRFKDLNTLSAYAFGSDGRGKRKRTDGDDAATVDPKAASGGSVGDVHGGGRR